MSALFDFPSLLTVILLFICSSTFTRALYPNMFTAKENPQTHDGLIGMCWKASRIGERISPRIRTVTFIPVCCGPCHMVGLFYDSLLRRFTKDSWLIKHLNPHFNI
eukprot:gene1789-3474_t